MMQQNGPHLPFLYKGIGFLLFLHSIFAWFLFGVTWNVVLLCSWGLLAVWILMQGRTYLNSPLTVTNFCVLLLLPICYLYLAKYQNAVMWCRGLMIAGELGIFWMLKDTYKMEMFDFISRYFCLLLAVSEIAWILYLLHVPLPSSQFSYGHSDGLVFFQYYFFLTRFAGETLAYRFQAFLAEPGHVATFTVFLLLPNLYLRKYRRCCIMAAAILLSLSLAGLILSGIALTSMILLQQKGSRKILLLTGLALCVILSGVILFQLPEDNLVRRRTIERLRQDDDNMIAGNTRTTENFDTFFEKEVCSRPLYLWFGYPRESGEEFEGHSAGYKAFIARNGLAGILLAILLYEALTRRYRNRFLNLMLFLYACSFLQRHYVFTEAVLMTLMTGAVAFNQKNSEVSDDKKTESPDLP